MSENNCWMCDEDKVKEILCPNVDLNKTPRIVDENENYYVIVPDNPLLRGHILIIRRWNNNKHHLNLTEADEYDFSVLNKAVKKWTQILKKAIPDCRNVFLTCLCDSKKVHLHYHLFPVSEQEKPYYGQGHEWLGNLENKGIQFGSLTESGKKARCKEIKEMVNLLDKAKKIWNKENLPQKKP